MSWLLVAALVIIWVAFLFPFKHRQVSPATSVEEFGRKMDLLAETNRSTPGRWIVMPRKGHPMLGPRERERSRIRRRRRTVFTFLLEATVLTLIIGVFPPLRKMLLGTAIFGGALLLYTLLLLRIRADEVSSAQRARARQRPVPGYVTTRPSGVMAGMAYTNGNGHRDGNGRGVGPRFGQPHPQEHLSWRGIADPDFRESGVRIIEDDVHVIVRPAAEYEFEPAIEAVGR